MPDTILTLQDPTLHGIKFPPLRKSERARGRLPAGLEVVSSDGHWEVCEDVFYERFPLDIRAKAPRVWLDDGVYQIGYPDRPAIPKGEVAQALQQQAFTDGLHDLELRLEHMTGDGVAKEIVFPQNILMFLTSVDLDVRENVFRIYNEYVAERGKLIPDRFYGVGVCSNWWDPKRIRSAVKQIKDLGLKTFMLPQNPGKNLLGGEMTYGAEEMDELWSAVEEFDIPVCFHVQESFNVEGRGVFGGFLLNTFGAFRKTLGQMIFGGVFDRFPGVQVVFAEGGISWIPPALQDAEMIYDSYKTILLPLKHRPTYYWHNNCYATFQNDRLGLTMLDYIGADRVMWASDYPHPEGSHGFTESSKEAVLSLTSPSIARKILGETAVKVFKL